MSAQHDRIADEVLCEACLNYSPSAPAQTPVADSSIGVNVAIRDGRRFANPGWQTSGFELRQHTSAVPDWADEQAIRDVHYDEIRTLAKAITGCDAALVSSHIKRDPEQAAIHGDLAPITFVHSDFAESYGPLIHNIYRNPQPDTAAAMAAAGVDAADIENATRLMIVQFWRNLGPAHMDLPIAFCDARTVPPADLRRLPVTDYAGGGFDFETLGIVAPADPDRHHWYTFMDMTPDEVVVFRTYDSTLADNGSGPFWTPHSAFAAPGVAPGKPSRRSIELRATCLFR